MELQPESAGSPVQSPRIFPSATSFAEASVPRDPVEPSIGPPRARRSTRELDAYQTDCKSESRTDHIIIVIFIYNVFGHLFYFETFNLFSFK